MRVELTRYRVLPGKSERVDEWMKMLNDRIDECLATLPREKMYVEAIFRQKVGGEEFLYWFSVQGEEGEDVRTSEHDLDIEHLKFARECLDPTYSLVDATGEQRRGRDLDLQLFLLPEHIRRSMEAEWPQT
jgi:hypothetical protein